MATSFAPQNSISLWLLIIVITSGTMNLMIVSATWCVARSTATPDELQVNLDYACGHGADCSAIQPGGSCYEPNTIYNHASYAFNSYYQHMHQAPDSCSFGGTATIALTDPSFGQCVYPPPRHSQRFTEGTSTSITMPAKDKQSATIDSKLKTFSAQRPH